MLFFRVRNGAHLLGEFNKHKSCCTERMENVEEMIEVY